MNINKTIPILLGVLILLGIYIVIFESPDKEYKQQEKNGSQLLFEDFNEETLQNISISKPGAETPEVVLVHVDGVWQVENKDNYPADTSLVDTLISFFKDAKRTTIISTNPDKQTEFNVSSTTGNKITLAGDGFNYTFYAGTSGTAMNSQFVRLDNSNDVIMANGNIIPVIANNPDDFRDKSIVSMASSVINRLELIGDDTQVLEKDANSSWIYQKNNETYDTSVYEVDMNAVNTAISTITTLNTLSFPEAQTVIDTVGEITSDTSDYTIKINGEETVLLVKEGEGTSSFIYSDAKNTYFEVSTDKVEELFTTEFLKEIPETVDEEPVVPEPLQPEMLPTGL